MSDLKLDVNTCRRILETKMTRELLTAIVRSKSALAHIPVIADANFGHTTPQFTFPVGGTGRISATSGGVQFSILEH